ncbi:MAG: lasso peptide biosynthesis PqqD family chaperone [Thermodesulfobacteriota bacterium]|nr:lasso peptide biosynthesis PqqD family chaperone [Thermodesulfobacteriota bacterium]
MSGKRGIDFNTVVTQVDRLISSDLDGETVMMSVENGKYYVIDSIGSRIWSILVSPHSVSDLCDILFEEFDVEKERCEHDVLDFINKLAEQNLIKVVDAEAG